MKFIKTIAIAAIALLGATFAQATDLQDMDDAERAAIAADAAIACRSVKSFDKGGGLVVSAHRLIDLRRVGQQAAPVRIRAVGRGVRVHVVTTAGVDLGLSSAAGHFV